MKYPNLLPLTGIVQDYDWGGYEYIPTLLDQENREKHPQAELWMGTHPRGMSAIKVDGQSMPLAEWIASDPAGILGTATARHFHNSLPFLFKILDVRKMLSIQAHPTKKAAVAGFARENEQGIPLSAGHRNYKDDNHKPEIMVALTDFWLLHGFRSEDSIDSLLREIPEFQSLWQVFLDKGIRGLYQHTMEMPQDAVDHLLAPLARRLEAGLAAGQLDRNEPDYWAAHAFRDYTRDGHYDRGVFSIYLFNLVAMQPGEGIFQAANIPHAYLEGVNVELMANSDNVFRGGLTSKHVDVGELMQHLSFAPVEPDILQGENRLPHERVYPAPVPDFDLSRIRLAPGEAFHNEKQEGPAIYIVLSGKISTEIGTMEKGAIFFSPHGARIAFEALTAAELFRAGVTV